MSVRLLVLLSMVESIIWLFPAFRQFSGRYFSFFCCLALASLLQLFFVYLHIIRFTNYVNLFFSIYMVFSFHQTGGKGIYKTTYGISTLILVGGLIQLHNHRIELLCLIFVWMVILSFLLRRIILETTASGFSDILTVCLILYTLSILHRIYFALSEAKPGLYYYAITEIFECIIGLFFIFFKEENKLLYSKIKQAVHLNCMSTWVFG